MGNYLLKNASHALTVGIATFISAIIIVLGSEIFLGRVTSILFSFLLLIIIIMIGVIFDVIGVAAAVADEAPFHAQAAKKQTGAKQSISLIRNADRVANFCSDVVGDIAGTVSGAIGLSIIFRMASMDGSLNQVFLGTIMTATVAALTVSGKSLGKTFAINESNRIMYMVGKLLFIIEKKFSIIIIKDINYRKKRR